MWKYSQLAAYDCISLHDCKADRMQFEGDDLVIHFPEGFKIIPVKQYAHHEIPLKTGPAQIRYSGIKTEYALNSVDIYKTTYLFGRTVLCRRIQLEASDFLKLMNNGKYELEFCSEFHAPLSVLYQGCLWKKGHGVKADFQFEITAKNIEYCWNEIRTDCEW